MKNKLMITVERSEDITSLVEAYEEEGFFFLKKTHSRDGYVVLEFEGDRELVAYNSRGEGQQGFIEFEDGTQSSLYIRQEKNFWED